MEQSIERPRPASRKHRRLTGHPDPADLRQKIAWLSWPLIYWRGSGQPRPAAAAQSGTPLHRLITNRLRSAPPGLYAMEPSQTGLNERRLFEITGPRLGAATHALALMDAAAAHGRKPDTAHGSDQQARAQLAMLSRCHRDLAASRCLLVPTRVREAAWILDGDQVEAPASLRRQIPPRTLCDHAESGVALFEYIHTADKPDPEQFTQALARLLDEHVRVEAEHERRFGILLSIAKEASLNTPAYHKVTFHSAKRGTITKWKPNRDFVRRMVDLALHHHLPKPVAASFPKGFGTERAFAAVCASFIGMELAPFPKVPLPESPVTPDVTTRWRRTFASQPLTNATEYTRQYACLAARGAASAGDVSFVEAASTWLAACRELCNKPGGGDGIWNWAVTSLSRWITIAGKSPANLRSLADILLHRSPTIAAQGWIGQQAPPESFWALANLGAIPRKDLLAAFDLGLLETYHEDFRGKAQQYAALLDFVIRNRRRWNATRPWVRRTWISLFSEIHDHAKLMPALLAWFRSLMDDRSFTFHDVSEFACPLRTFLIPNRGMSDRQEREEFLRNNMWLLNRLLREVDDTLRALPANGFDNWRSHDALWDCRFDLVELCYQWHAAQFSDGTGMVEAVLRWCRRDDLQFIEKKKSYPPEHFHNMGGSEELVVRLSGGDPQQLIGLLGYRANRWQEPDNPFKGWMFLAQYPPAHAALQDICRSPRRLHGATQTLSRLALALRLKRHRFVEERLKAWVAASALPNPLESIQAYRRIRGCTCDLPPALEAVMHRSEALHREQEALRKMADAGEISRSAEIRLAKLTHLLADRDKLAVWISRDTQRAATKMLPMEKANALSAITRQAVRAHWVDVIDRNGAGTGADWDNAIRFYYSVSQNRGILRHLLQHTVRAQDDWRLHHPPNAKFLHELATNGFNPEQWLAPFETSLEVPGELWTLHLERNPLRVLQMGNFFDTCLSVHDFNAYSAVANAVEINKQVLYIRDGKGNIVGRKLIGLTSDGRLIGFRSYGAACLEQLDRPEKPHVWIKIHFDLACLAIAHRTGARLDQSADNQNAPEQLRLAADWYNDGDEPFDWWVLHPDLRHALIARDRTTIVKAIHDRINDRGFRMDADEKDALQTLRALVWLGEDAREIVTYIIAGKANTAVRHYLQVHAPALALAASA